MQGISRTWTWIIIVFVVVVLGLALFFYGMKGFSRKLVPVSGPVPALAPQGQVVAGFPQNLLIDSGAQVTKSYSISYSSTTSQYTVEWNSSSSPRNLAVGYLLYLQNNNWTIVNQATSSPTLQNIYAVSTSGSLNLVATTQGGGSAVTLSYIPPSQEAALSSQASSSLPQDFPAFLNPDPSSTLVLANASGSSELAIFASSKTVSNLSLALMSSFAKNKWKVIQSQVATSSAFIQASLASSNAQASIFIQTLPSNKTQVQVQYFQ